METKRGNAVAARAAFTRAVKRCGGDSSAVTLQVGFHVSLYPNSNTRAPTHSGYAYKAGRAVSQGGTPTRTLPPHRRYCSAPTECAGCWLDIVSSSLRRPSHGA